MQSNSKKRKKQSFLMQPPRRYSIKNNIRKSKDNFFEDVVMKGSKRTGRLN